MSRELTPQEIAERSLIKTYRKSLWNPFVAAVKRYELVSPGDHIAVCISGGKDSMVLAKLMQELQRHTEQPFSLTFLGMDPGYNMENRALMESNAALLGIPVEVFESDIFDVTTKVEKNPCYLCARMRRGWLYAKAQELGCNKVALGHHLDDAVETFYMNLWREGRIGCFSPVTQLDRRGLTLIRPMLLATEHEVRCAVKEEDFPIVKSRCPADGVTVREQTKDFVRERCRTDHAFRQKTLHALQESGIDGWRQVHTGRTSNPSPKEGMHHADAEL